jgi:Flp pilus assembly protein TadG
MLLPLRSEAKRVTYERSSGPPDPLVSRQVTRRSARARLSSQVGAAAVEFALVAVLLFMLIFGIIEFGFAFHAWDATSNAAREGARVGAVNPNVATIEARVRAASDFLDQSKLTVTIQCQRGGGGWGACGASSTWLEGDLVRVTVDYAHDYMTPFPNMIGLGPQLAVQSISESRFEG